MKRVLFALVLSTFFILVQPVQASEDIPHYTVIINQVRGRECCDIGSLEAFENQQIALQERALPATFSIRYDVLRDPAFVAAIKRYPDFEYAALLEITPSLAAAAEVAYRGTDANWFEAQHVFLVGYSEGERMALIDAYMAEFKEVFGSYPKTTNAWMIDPISLRAHFKTS